VLGCDFLGFWKLGFIYFSVSARRACICYFFACSFSFRASQISEINLKFILTEAEVKSFNLYLKPRNGCQQTQPIYADGQGNQLDQATWLGSETYSSCFPQGSQASRIVACCNSPNSSEANRGVDNVGTCEEPMPRWNSLRFAGLLSLADAASAASGNGEAQGNDGVATSSFMSDKCQNENNGGDYLSASLFWNRDPSLDSELGANGNSMPEQPYCKCD
jgi:hypothetical protein